MKIFLAASLLLLALFQASKADDSWDYTLEHSLDGVTFQERNNFRIRVSDLASGRKKVEFSPYEVDADTVQKLLTLSKNGESYLLRTNVRPSGVAPAYVTTHVPACALVASGLVESIIFHLDSTERLISFEYANEIFEASSPVCSDTGGKKLKKIKSRGVVSQIESSKLPVTIDGNIFYNAAPGSPQAIAQGGAAAGSKAAPVQEQSFFQKYKWYLIIGVIVYVVMGALNNPELKAQMAQAQAQAGK